MSASDERVVDKDSDTGAVDVSSIDVDALKRERRLDYNPFGSNDPDDDSSDLTKNLAWLAKAREVSPMTYSTRGEGFWVATGYDEVVSVLRNSNKGFVSYPNNPYGAPPGSRASLHKAIPIDLDGAEHREFRRVLEPVFSPSLMQALEPQMRALANRLIDDWIETGNVNFVDGFAFPFSATTVILLMGWPLEDANMMSEWVHVMLHGVPGATAEETAAAQIAASGEYRAYLSNLMADRRNNPGDDITTMLMNIEMNGSKLSDEDLIGTFVLFMLAGLDTVQSVLSQTFAYLGTHPDKWDEMFAEPGNVDLAVEEFLRWTAPAPPTRNVTAEFMMVGDVPVPKGERVHCVIGAANRDPKYFPNPDEVDFHRPSKPHLTFGLGPHRCIGIHLARLEIRIAFEELRARIPRFSLDQTHEPQGRRGAAWAIDNVYLAFPPGMRQALP